MWELFKRNGKKKNTSNKKKKPVVQKTFIKQNNSKILKEQKQVGISKDLLNSKTKIIDKKVTEKGILSIEQLRKEFEEKQKVIDALEKKIHKKKEGKLSPNIPEKIADSIDINKKLDTLKNIKVQAPKTITETNKSILKKDKNTDAIILDFKGVFQLIDDTLEGGFLGGVIADKKSHSILYSHNIEANDTSFLEKLLQNIEQSLQKSSFPPLNKFYMMDLVDDLLMLNLLFEDQIYYLIFNKNETNLGLVLNVLYDKIKQRHLEIITNLKK